MATSWFVRGGGKVYGPLDPAKLKKLVADGKINEATEVAQSQAGPWFPAGKLRGLFDAAAVKSPPPMEPAMQEMVLPGAAVTQTTSGPTQNLSPANVTSRSIPAYLPRSTTGKVALVAGLCSLLSLVLGYFAGREHLRYQIRSSFQDVGKNVVDELKKNISDAFNINSVDGEKSPSKPGAKPKPEPKPEPLAQLKLGEPYDTPEASFTVTAACVENPSIQGGMSNKPSQHEERCLVIRMTIHNKDDRKQLRVSYGNRFDEDVFGMRDDVDNAVRTMFFSGSSTEYKIVGAHPSFKPVDPGQTVEHLVAFAQPLPKTKSLTMTISKSLIGQEGAVEYSIPIDAVDGFVAD